MATAHAPPGVQRAPPQTVQPGRLVTLMDPTYIFLFVALAGFIVFQVFQGRKRKRETEEKLSKFLPGVEIMTNYGLYGTIIDIDDERNLVTLEISPGVEVKIHKQTMLKVADYNDMLIAAPDGDDADAAILESDGEASRDTDTQSSTSDRTGITSGTNATPDATLGDRTSDGPPR